MNFMFYGPIRLIPKINSLEELIKYSIQLSPPQTTPLTPKQYIHVGDYYFFNLEDGMQFITVSWVGINDSFFSAYGFQSNQSNELTDFCLNFIKKLSLETSMLKEQAELQFWSYAFDHCYRANQLRQTKLDTVEIPETLEVHDVTFEPYTFQKTLHHSPLKEKLSVTCYGMVSCYPEIKGLDNCGTFIFGKTFLLVCDEYGRTFLILQTENMISLSPIVDRLLKANYQLNHKPDNYIYIHRS